MKLLEWFVRSPVKVSVIILLLSLFGAVGLLGMPMQLTPEVQTPTLTIETRWPGASPMEVERSIILEQEEQLKGVEGVTKMTSESMSSLGRITLEFRVGANLDEALLRVNSRLNQVPEYPEDAKQPVISTANASDRPIAWFILGPRVPKDAEFDAFLQKHPQLKDELASARRAQNPALRIYRLRGLVDEHPEVQELLPAPIDVTKLRRFAEDAIEAQFERVDGVSNSNVIGGLEDELQVIVEPQLLAARQLTIADVRRVLMSQNADISGGDFWEAKRRWVVRTVGQFRSPEQVGAQLLAVRDGRPVYIRDVAEVREDFKKPDGQVRRYGESLIAINVIRQTGANVLDVMDGLKAEMERLNNGVLKQRGVQLSQVYDETEYIYSAVGLVQENIFLGSALTMIVLMMFLHLGVRALAVAPLIAAGGLAAVYLSPWFFVLTLALIIGVGFWFARGALVVGLAIPISIIGTFLVLALLGRSLNVISLAGLAFAVGMLVDSAVVVLENIYSHFQRGESPVTAAVRGAHEVWGAVTASTLTTVAVFLPVIFVQEEAGQLFRDIALAISAAVALSLFVSVIVVPPAAARLFSNRPEKRGRGFAPAGAHAGDNGRPAPPQPAARQSLADKIADRAVYPIRVGGAFFVELIVGANAFLQKSLLRGLSFIGVVLAVTVLLGWIFWPKVEYLPTGNRNLIIAILLPPPGYNLDQLTEMGKQVENDLKPYWNADAGTPEARELEFPVISDFFFVVRDRQVFIGLRAADPARVGELIPLVRQVGFKLPGTFAVAKQSSLFEQGLTAGRTIDIEITGPELPQLVGLGGQVFGQVMTVIPNAQAIPKPSLDLSSPEVHVDPRLMQAAELGLNASDMGYAVSALIDGAYAGDYYVGGDKIDLTIRGRGEYAQRTQDVAALPLATPSGELVPLSTVAHVRLASGPEQINHRERLRAVTIEVTPPPEMALEDAMFRVQTQIIEPMQESGQLGEDYRINLSGTADKLRQTWSSMQWNLAMALLITYLLMAALYESWLYPFVIILSVPLGAIGGLLGLAALNRFVLQPLDVLTMLGFVILIGTVVNNAILIVDQALQHLRFDDMAPREAVVQAVRSRVRPIFMTTTTTVIGLLPLVLFPGAGSELYRGLGSVVLGGLIVSTGVTLFLVPTVFTIFLRTRTYVVGLFAGEKPTDVQVIPAPHHPIPREEPASAR